MQMTGNTILVTGGDTGIGRGLAESFHQLGNHVIIAGRRLEPLLAVAEANPGIEHLSKSDAVILNIDYPLGMAAYHLLSRLGQAVGDLRGIYVMGKAATLNGRVGDVMLSGNVYDEHSQNTFLFKNAFSAKDVRSFLRYGSVFDNQSALTVRSVSRVGKGDLGANTRHVLDLYDALATAGVKGATEG